MLWIIGWDLIIEYSISNIYVAKLWSEHFTKLFGNSALECDWIAAGIVLLVTTLLLLGIKETKWTNNFFVMMKIIIFSLVIVLGFYLIFKTNTPTIGSVWTPFFPKDMSHIFAGLPIIIFSYIGFDALSTMGEESKNPQRDLPRAMFYALIISAVIYLLVVLVVSGTHLAKGQHLSVIFEKDFPTIATIIDITALIAMFGVLISFTLGQPRILLAMSRDGLLPAYFAKIHPKTKVPMLSTILTGLLVAIPCLFMNKNDVVELTSAGTLVAFMLVAVSVIVLQINGKHTFKFKIPYAPACWFLIPLSILYYYYAFSNGSYSDTYGLFPKYQCFFAQEAAYKYPLISLILFNLILMGLNMLSFIRRLSLIPTIALISCAYCLCWVETVGMIRLIVFLFIGLVVYFAYGFRKNAKHKS